ncbi:MAG: LCP family protein [Eubacteriaceae bacterium]|nr:LCP family protein [Eubacteriaceae bacterium]
MRHKTEPFDNKVAVTAFAMLSVEAVAGIYALFHFYKNGAIPERALAMMASFFGLLWTFHYSALRVVLPRKILAASCFASIAITGIFVYSIATFSTVAASWDDVLAVSKESTEPVYLYSKNADWDILNNKHVVTYGFTDFGQTDFEAGLAALKEEYPTVWFEPRPFNDPFALIDGFHAGICETMLLNAGMASVFSEEVSGFADGCRVLWSKEIESPNMDFFAVLPPNEDDISQKPFNIFISGVDASGVLSDVNMIATINPQERKVLLTGIPRDTLVPLWGDEDKVDKLTHAGLYGVNCSIETLEDFFGIKIDYYAQFGFNSVVEIVDALGGVDVVSEYAFSSVHSLNKYTNYRFEKGSNHLDGRAALAFVRERKSLPSGDFSRVKNQQAFMLGVIKRLVSPYGLANFSGIFKVAANTTETNVSFAQAMQLSKLTLSSSTLWSIEGISITGTVGSHRTYSFPNRKLSCVIANQASIKSAKDAIQELLAERAYNIPNR